MSVRVAVIYYSATGNVYRLARAIAEGAEAAGAEVRMRKVPELAPEAAIRSNPRWHQHTLATSMVGEATLDDLAWADAYAFGTPTRYGNVAAQLRQFIDTTGGLWEQGKLADKVATGFTSAHNVHGGQETTLLSMYQVFMHWGAILVPPGYTDEVIYAAGGNPYGISATHGDVEPALAAARYQGRRITEMAAVLRRRAAPVASQREPALEPEYS